MSEPPPIDDPFATSISSEQGVLRPRPGGWGAARRADEFPGRVSAGDGPMVDQGLNPLVAAANRLLLLVPQLRETRHVADPDSLRASLAQGIRDFAKALQERGIAPERVMAARYVMCTMLDEAASDTPWGGGGLWARHSLLAEFHNEAFGGEKVFQLMARLAENPAANRDLLELIYAALALGFEGRYRVIANGKAQLEAVRAKLADIIKQERGTYPPALAAHWQVEPLKERPGLSWLPLALVSAGVALMLASVYALLSWSLSGRSDEVYGKIQSLRLSPPVAAVAQPTPVPRLAVLLQPDVRARTVEVRDEIDRSVVTVRGDGLFAPASAALVPEREALMQRIAQALVRVGGEVLITGHTDSTPIRTLRYPSNWHLSDDRARSVRDIFVKAGVPSERIRAEGRADGDRVAPDDTPANRALNRRVEITLLAARTDAQPRRSSSPSPAEPAAAASGVAR
ncbi:MAG TPA: DotU family type VI secretion system protein [Rubrivivax sp.]|nr:DotU family type VI secretion system protein [Rubrivivax sp.]